MSDARDALTGAVRSVNRERGNLFSPIGQRETEVVESSV